MQGALAEGAIPAPFMCYDWNKGEGMNFCCSHCRVFQSGNYGNIDFLERRISDKFVCSVLSLESHDSHETVEGAEKKAEKFA